jgi:putative transposase
LGSQDPVLCGQIFVPLRLPAWTERLGRIVGGREAGQLLAWYRKLIANKFDGSKFRKSGGRPRVDEETERLVVRMAKENPGWGHDRIVGAMANLGLRLSDQTVGNILSSP